MPEEEAYDTLKYLMVNLGLRRQYRPDMESLQVGLVYHINPYPARTFYMQSLR